jgi:hypothetical protein
VRKPVAGGAIWGRLKGLGENQHMSLIRAASAAAFLSLGVIMSPPASAADLPVKAVPIVGPSVPLDVHGFADFTLATNRVTGGGLLLYPRRGVLEQINGGLSLDLYKDPAGFINKVSLYGGVWNEFWSSPGPGARSWQEMDLSIGANVTFAQYWTFTAEHVQFHFPNAIPTAYNYVFTLAYSDAHWGWAIPLNPFISVFYNASGGSTVVLGKTSGGYRVTVGIAPSITPFAGVPLTLTAPTSFVFGPSEFWNRADGTTNVCGALGTAPCATSSAGFFSTGLQARYGLESVIPKRLGSWYVKGGFQYYHILNDALLAAQVVTGAANSFATAHKDVVVGFAGIGFTF